MEFTGACLCRGCMRRRSLSPIRAGLWRRGWRRFRRGGPSGGWFWGWWRGWNKIPAGSPYGRLIADVLAWSKQYPDDWKKVWNLIEEKWDKREPCPEGAARPFNIDAKLNGGYIVLGLIYGKGDFRKTIEVATRAG